MIFEYQTFRTQFKILTVYLSMQIICSDDQYINLLKGGCIDSCKTNMIFSSVYSQCVCIPGYSLTQQTECVDDNVTWLSATTDDSQNNCTDNQTLGFFVDNSNQVNAICGTLVYQVNDDYSKQNVSYCSQDSTKTFSSYFSTCYTRNVTNPQDYNLEAAINLCYSQNQQGCYYIMNQCGLNNREACQYQNQFFPISEEQTLNVISWPEKYRRYNASNVSTWKNIVNIRAVILKEDGTPIKSFLFDPEHFNLCKFYQTGNIENTQEFQQSTRINKYQAYKIAEMLRRSGKSYTATAFANGYPSQFGNNYQSSCQYDGILLNDTEIYYIAFYTDNIDENYQLAINSNKLSMPLFKKEVLGTQTRIATISSLSFDFKSYYDGSVKKPTIQIDYNSFITLRDGDEDVQFIDTTKRTYANRVFNNISIENKLETKVSVSYSLATSSRSVKNILLILYCILYVAISFVQEIIPMIQLYVGTGQIVIQQLLIILYTIIDKILYAITNASWHYQVILEICFLIDQQGTKQLFYSYEDSILQSTQIIFIYGMFLIIKNFFRMMGTYFRQFNIFYPYRLQAINHSTNYSERNLIYRSFYKLMIGNEKIVYILIILTVVMCYITGMLYYGQYSNMSTNILKIINPRLSAPVWSLVTYGINLLYKIIHKIYVICKDQCNFTNTDFIFFDSQQSAIFVKGEKNYIQQGVQEMSQQVISEAIGKKQPRGIQGIQQFRLITSIQDEQVNDYYQALATIYTPEKDAGNVLAPQKSTKFIIPSSTPAFGQQYENKMLQLDSLQDNMLQKIARKQISFKLKHFQFIPDQSQLVADTQLCGSQQANISSRNYQPINLGLQGFFGQFAFDYVQYLMIFLGFVLQSNYIGGLCSIFMIWFAQYLNKLSWKRLISQQACIHGNLLE